MSAHHAFPWDDVMALGLSVLRWDPSEFWRATPREVMAAIDRLRGGRESEPAGGSDLRRLMEAYPDETRSITGTGDR